MFIVFNARNIHPDPAMAVTITEIANIAGVSHSTVSRLVRNDPKLRISERRRQEILDIIESKGGCTPHRSARALVSRRAEVLLWPFNREQKSLLLQDSHVGSTMMHAAEEHARENGYRLTIVFYQEQQKHQEMPALWQRRDFADGAFFAWGIIDDRLAQDLNRMRYPHVVFDWEADKMPVNAVLGNERTGITQAIRHFVDLGHRRISFIGREPVLPRFHQFIEAAADLGVAIRPQDFALEQVDSDKPGWENQCRQLGQREMLHLLDATDCTAAFCETDGFAFGALDALYQRSLQPGRDFSLIGFDDVETKGWQPFGAPLLTTVYNPLAEIGRRAAQWLIEQITEGWQQPRIERLDTKLLIRRTTDPLPRP